jgi:hypothetical protein
VLSSENFSEAAFSKQLVYRVLIDYLTHVKLFALWFNIEFIAILYKSNVIILQLKSHQIVKKAIFWIPNMHFLA